jgi:DNA-directed RNA polymerase subunit RPC12/RpoP
LIVKCSHCGYEWDSKSPLFYVTCPKCMKKTKIEGVKK